jgi:hypothetical protein
MKKIVLSIMVAGVVLAIGCTKYSSVPAYTPPVTANITVTSMNHTKDTVNVGDTLYLNVAGTLYDTLNVFTYLTVASSASGAPVLTYGTSAAPIKLTTVLGSMNPTAMNTWTSTIRLIGATSTHKSKLTITGNFISQLSLSSEGGGTTSATDAGIVNKTVYVQ